MRLVLCFFLVVAFGCNDSELLVTPDDNGETSLAKHDEAKMVPITGQFSHWVDPAGGFVPCFAPDGSVATMFPARLLAYGEVRHLGRTNSVVTIDECLFDPTGGTLYGIGMGYHTAANGDELHADYAAILSGDGSFVFDFITFSGGTGRLSNAVGYADGGGVNNTETGEGAFWFDGMVSSVGSSK